MRTGKLTTAAMRCPEQEPRAFSLVELLVVIAIVGILAALTLSGVGLLGSSAPGQRKHDLAQLIEQARVLAMSRQTHVWIGFQEVSSPEPLVRVALIASVDGTSDVLAATNLHPLVPPKSFKRVILSRESPPAGGSAPVLNSVRSGDGTVLNVGGGVWSNIVMISPQGFVSLPPNAPGPHIGIGLGPAAGKTPTEWLRIQPVSGKVIYEDN